MLLNKNETYSTSGLASKKIKLIGKRLLSHRGSKIWEKIDHSLKSLSWLSFKKQYKKFYYPVRYKINWVPDYYHDFLQNNCKNATYVICCF